MAGGPNHEGCGPGLSFLDHAAEETLLALACPDITPGLPPGWGHTIAGPPTPPLRPGYQPAAPGGAPLPQAMSGHWGSGFLPCGAHQAGPGARPGHVARGLGPWLEEGGGGASCRRGAHPSQSPVSPRALSARPVVTARSGGEKGGGGGGCSLTRSLLRPVQGTAAAPRRLGPMPSRNRPTPEWGPLPPPGRSPPIGRGPEPSPRRGAPSWVVGV